MLNIINLDLLKITKVKSWAIYFTYDLKYYLLHGSYDDDEVVELYERELYNCGNYKLKLLKSKSESSYFANDYINCHKHVIVYSQIDKEFFVKKLTYKGFITSLYDEEIKQRKLKIKAYENEIRSLNDKISSIRDKICYEKHFEKLK